MGAICYGFTTDESIGVVGADGTTGAGGFSMYSRVNVSSGPVLVGDVQVARRGFHPYPVPDVGEQTRAARGRSCKLHFAALDVLAT